MPTAPTTATWPSRTRRRTAQTVALEDAAAGDEFFHGGIGGGAIEVQPGLFADLAPGRNDFGHGVFDFHYLAIGRTTIIIGRHG